MDDAVEEEKVIADRAFPFEFENPLFFVTSKDKDEGGDVRIRDAPAVWGAKSDGDEGVTKALVVIDETKQ